MWIGVAEVAPGLYEVSFVRRVVLAVLKYRTAARTCPELRTFLVAEAICGNEKRTRGV